MGQPLYLNSINPLLMWFLSSVKIKKYFQTIQHFAFESKMIFNLFPYCSCHSHGLSLSQYALLGITIKTNMSEFKHLSTGQCLNTSRHGVRAEGVYPLKAIFEGLQLVTASFSQLVLSYCLQPSQFNASQVSTISGRESV